MFEETLAFLLSRPSRLKAIGVFLSSTSATLIILGLLLRRGVIAVEAIQNMAKVATEKVTLSLLYQEFPTWFIPESALGYVFLMVIFAVGMCAQMVAKKIGKDYF